MMASSYKRYIPVQNWKGIVKLQTKQDCCSVAANPDDVRRVQNGRPMQLWIVYA